eukprot:4489444-Amphidinium_carterae.1
MFLEPAAHLYYRTVTHLAPNLAVAKKLVLLDGSEHVRSKEIAEQLQQGASKAADAHKTCAPISGRLGTCNEARHHDLAQVFDDEPFCMAWLHCGGHTPLAKA